MLTTEEIQAIEYRDSKTKSKITEEEKAELFLVHLKKYDQKKGVAAICLGGGEATALALEVS